MDVVDDSYEGDTDTTPLLQRGVSRRDVLKTGLAGAAAVSGVSVLAACGSASKSDPAAGAPSKPVRGGTFVVGMLTAGTGESLSVWQSFDQPGTARLLNLYDPLFEIGPKGLRPGLAESAEPNADATVWTIKLRDGVTWHNGKPLTADDVVYTIKNWSNPDNYISPVMSVLIDPQRTRKRDARTVEVGLRRPVGDFPSVTCHVQCLVIPEGTRKSDFGKNPVGTGPFAFESFTPGKRSVFTANANYWGGRPYVDKLVFDTSFTDENARFNALRAGEVHTVPQLPFGLAAANKSSTDIRVTSAVGASCYQFAMNLTKPPFNDVRVRQALRLLADRQGIINSAMAGYGHPGNDVPGRGLKYYASDLKRDRDVEQARSLLTKAGQQDLHVTLETGEVMPGAVDVATVYARNAADAGVKVNVKRVDAAAYYSFDAGYTKRGFSFAYPGGGSNIPSLTLYYLFTLWSKAPAPEVNPPKSDDALLFDAIGELDEAKAKDKWHEVQQNQYDRGGYINFVDLAYVDGYRKNVGGLDASYGGWNSAFQYEKAFLAT
jgi:peptide/nickel transport system substrate-binding protein